MDTVVLDGVSYVKASVVAKDFKYTSDYIGQLCRSKKVDARLVGRTWFVNPDSVVVHKGKKHKNSKSTETKVAVKTSEIKPSRVEVNPVISSKVAKQFSLKVKNETSAINERTLPVSYELDDESLLPNIIRKKTPPPRRIVVEHANAKKIRVRNKPKYTSFIAEDIPDVALSGNLDVTSYPDKKVEVKPKKPKAASKSDIKNHAPVAPETVDKTSKNTESKAKNMTFLEKVEEKSVVKKKMSDVTIPTITPKTKTAVVETKRTFVPTTIVKKEELKESQILLLSPLISTVAAAVCVALIFSASSSILATGSVYDSHVVLQVANLLEILDK